MRVQELLELNIRTLSELQAVGAKASDVKFLAPVQYFNDLRSKHPYDYCVAMTCDRFKVSESQLARKVKLLKKHIQL